MSVTPVASDGHKNTLQSVMLSSGYIHSLQSEARLALIGVTVAKIDRWEEHTHTKQCILVLSYQKVYRIYFLQTFLDSS